MSEHPRGLADPVALSYADKPLVIDDASQYPWDESTDVLVVGYGAARHQFHVGFNTGLVDQQQRADILVCAYLAVHVLTCVHFIFSP